MRSVTSFSDENQPEDDWEHDRTREWREACVDPLAGDAESRAVLGGYVSECVSDEGAVCNTSQERTVMVQREPHVDRTHNLVVWSWG